MLKKINLRTQITLLILILAIFILAVEVSTSLLEKKDLIRKTYYAELNIISEVQQHNIENEIQFIFNELHTFSTTHEVLDIFINNPELPRDSSSKSKNFVFASTDLLSQNDFTDLFMFDSKHELIYQHNQKDSSLLKSLLPNFNELKKGEYHTQTIQENRVTFFYVSVPVYDIYNKFLGNIGVKVPLIPFLHKAVDAKLVFGNSGEILLAHRKKNKIEYFFSSLNTPISDLTSPIDIDHPMIKACSNNSGYGEYKDYHENKVLARWNPITSLGLGIIVKVDGKEAYELISGLYNDLTIKISLTIFLAIILGIGIERLIMIPLNKIHHNLNALKNGEVPDKLDIYRTDAIGRLSNRVNELRHRFQEITEFIQNLMSLNFDSAQITIGPKDTLGGALIELQMRLQEINLKDTEQTWVIKGVADLASTLRAHNNIPDLSDALNEFIAERINARQACIYTFNDDEKSLHLAGAYAFGKKKHIEKTFSLGKDLVGQTAFEKKTVFRTEIPKDYDYIPSGLKNQSAPKSALIVPLILNEKLLGVLEYNGDKRFNKREVSFIEEISEIVAQTIFSIQVNQNTRSLLDTIQHAQVRQRSLLENASEIIFIVEKDGKVSYVSPSVGNITGIKENQILNKPIQKVFYEDAKKDFSDILKNLINAPTETILDQFEFQRNDKKKIWLQMTAQNKLDNPAIKGLVLNYTDITEKKRAEEEEKKRGQMQALSENSLDLITRVSAEGMIFYVNPIIEKITGEQPESFINKKLEDTPFDPTYVEGIKGVIDKVMRQYSTLEDEIEFNNSNGEKLFMHISAIPELNESKKIESILIVSHDVTQRKAIENEIKEKNKKIEESINYAERIQSTIFPDEQLLKEVLPDSFMMFKPKDVVSGDFPWFIHKEDFIYLAAVDCTGHGVPGAMISFVGYFLLNNAINNHMGESPGAIMDIFDKSVIEAFRQNDENAKIKDGMDMGFAKIHLKKRIVEYSGAHRPLYIIKKDSEEIEEIKGDKFPVGGGSAYRNKTNFKNTRLELEEGDTIYFFSDGYPDQFGGEKFRKFGPKRIKEMVLSGRQKSIPQLEQDFENAYNDWKGVKSQTDDILVFGIRF